MSADPEERKGGKSAAGVSLRFGCLTWSKVVDNIEVSIWNEVNENGWVQPEPPIGIFFQIMDPETGIIDDYDMQYEGELWGLQPA